MAQSRRPFGRSADLGERANAVRTATVTFPLTPALSLGERGNPPLPFSTTQRGVRPTNLLSNLVSPPAKPEVSQHDDEPDNTPDRLPVRRGQHAPRQRPRHRRPEASSRT